jgi:coenzyme F420-reducing hydrogenase delta subunit/quinol-cytochrome oxidoreductase complex cytochrome b subunit/NAD-dependent dihydropyrimidine dehydrogenase PreA subunit
VSLHAFLRNHTQTLFQRIEEALDAVFEASSNPLRHLGAMGLYLLWVIVGTGLYLYTVLDTGIVGVYDSIGYQSRDLWYFGGILRSLHRYASDAFILVIALHLLREWAYGRYYGFRFYSWITGIPLIWLMYASGISGYWIVWDQLAQFSATATTELLDWLPIFSEPSARNFLAPDSINDRFFTMLVFLHIGMPLLLILGLWAHVHRISRVDYLPSRQLMLGTLATLLLLALIKPALSNPPANLAIAPSELHLDWFILFIHPLTDITSPAVVWSLLFGATALLFLLPFLPHPKSGPVAVVDPANCNGCSRCLADCPYAAISMEPHPSRPGYKIAIVAPDLCASCGICAGSCPSSTPFRRQEQLITGIDMPQQSVNALRQQLEAQLAQLTHGEGRAHLVVFGCSRGADAHTLAAPDTAVISLLCTGILPPSFVEYALRGGADGVVISTCRQGGCDFRLGDLWTAKRLSGQREPHLRTRVPLERLQIVFASSNDDNILAEAVQEFRSRIETEMVSANQLQPYFRRTTHHA